MMNKKLSICIPTYNRPELLEKALKIFLDEAKEFNVPVYISDDSTNDKTKNMVEKLKKEYPLIFYRKNSKPLGIEENFFSVLNMSDTRYRWLLGDDDSLTKGAIKRVLSILDKDDFDGVIVNACRLKDKRFPEKGCRNLRVKHLKTKVYTDRNELLRELGWHTTFMSTIIYSEKTIQNFDKSRYKGTIFPQFVLFYHYLGLKEKINVYWDSTPTVYTLNIGSLGGASWFKNIVKIFTKDWFEAVFSLPDTYTEEAKLKCIKSHDLYTGVFSPLKLLYIRSFGYLNRDILDKYRDFIPYAVNTPKPVLYLSSIFPVPLAAFLREVYIKIKGGH